MAWYVYMLHCGDGSLYTGSTTDVARRLREHQNGTGAKYTRARPPVTLAYTEEAPDRSAAQCREAAIKKLPRERKLALIKDQITYTDTKERKSIRPQRTHCREMRSHPG